MAIVASSATAMAAIGCIARVLRVEDIWAASLFIR
jgi:hypothetical protein